MSLVSDVKTDVNMREVTFSFTAEQLEDACQKVYLRQRKDIAVKGFRKGKVPRKMVEKLYGEEVFFEDAINMLLPEELGTIIKDLAVEVIDRPSVEIVSCSKAEGAVCKATLITKPEVTVGEYKGLHAPMQVREVTEEDIDQQIEQLRQRQARIIDIDDRAAQLGDEVKINFEGFIDGEAFEGGKGEDYPLRLGSGQFIPGFEDQVVGKSIGDEFDVNVTFPENYGDDRYAGKDAVFKVKLLAISAQELPEIDDEFAKDVSSFDTISDLREDIQKRLTEAAQRQAEAAFENTLFDTLLKNSDAVIPKVMYDRRINQKVREFEMQLQQQYSDLKLEEYLQLTGMTLDQLKDEYEPQAKNEVLLRLALEKIADQEDIQVSDEELEEGLQDFAAQHNAPLEYVKQSVPVEEFRMDLRVTKVVEFIKSNAVVDNDMAADAAETAEAEVVETEAAEAAPAEDAAE